jgi:sugar/nucleoside kinase (ribokinase family)
VLVSVGDLAEEILVRLGADPVRGGDATVRSARIRGASAGNVAAIDAELGGSPRFVGRVGDDVVGHALVDDLRRRGVEVHVEHAGTTGVIVTMVGRGGRSRLIDRGASRRLATIDPAVLDGAGQLYLPASAFTDEPLASAVDRLLGEAADRRVPVTVGGPTSVDLDSLGATPFLELCATLGPAHVVMNRAEHASLGLDPRERIPGSAVTVVTNGPRPSLVMERGGVRPVEVPPIDGIIDRTGVGDGFLAGFLASRRSGADPVSAAHAGHRVAAKVLHQLGPTTRAQS